VLNVLMSVAQWERETIGERTKDGMGVKRTRGERISRHPPFGWEFGTDGKLVENPRELEAIRQMTQLRAQGWGFNEIAQSLNETGVRPKRATKWARATVRQILKRVA